MRKMFLAAALPSAAVMLARTGALTRENPAQAAAAEGERRQPMAGFQGRRFAGFSAASYDATARTVEAVLSTGSEVRRYYFTEELEISDEAIDLGRVERGLVCLLDAHNQWETGAVLGQVSNVRIENGELVGTLHFGETDRAREIEGMVARGELRGVSIGYKVTTWEITRTDPETERETWRAVRWELLEVSLVPVPADANAGVRSNGGTDPGATEEEDDMLTRNVSGGAAAPATTPPATPTPPAAAPATEQARATTQAPAATPTPEPTPSVARFGATEALAFVEDARAFGVEARGQELVQQNERGDIGVEAARAALLRAAAERQRTETAPVRAGPTATVSNGNEEASRALIVDALSARALGNEVPEAAREFAGMRLMELALARSGLSTRERDPNVVIRAALTTSDFPIILENVANNVLLARYREAAPIYREIAERRDLVDFRETGLVRAGDFPTLLPYLEDGEIKAGVINEGKEKVQLGSYGRILNITRQALVNDHLGVFDQVFGSYGRTLARFENKQFWAVKNLNGGLGPKLSDNKTVFHADHGNLAGAGALPSVLTLGAARAAMMVQKDLDGELLDVMPSVLLTSPTIITEAEKIVAPLIPAQSTNVNPFSGKLTPLSSGHMTGNAWELYDPANPVWVYGYLADAPGPRVMTNERFTTDGVSIRVTLDFYAGAIDYRGAYRNPGAAPA